MHYSSSKNEDEKKEEDKIVGKEVGAIKVSVEEETPSVPTVTPTPSTPPTQVAMVNAVQSNDDVEVQNLISSLSKLYEKQKSVKSLEKTLTSILDRLAKIVSFVDNFGDI